MFNVSKCLLKGCHSNGKSIVKVFVTTGGVTMMVVIHACVCS